MLTNVFSPLCPEEFSRVLKKDGLFYYVVPSALHLWEMKQVLYDVPYENAVKREDYPGFRWLRAVPLRYTVHLDCSQDIMALFGMTPYAWKTPKAGVARLAALEQLDTQIGFGRTRVPKSFKDSLWFLLGDSTFVRYTDPVSGRKSFFPSATNTKSTRKKGERICQK